MLEDDRTKLDEATFTYGAVSRMELPAVSEMVLQAVMLTSLLAEEIVVASCAERVAVLFEPSRRRAAFSLAVAISRE
jgi:hypothetical protein